MINYLANNFSCKAWQEFKNKQEGKLRNWIGCQTWLE